MYHLSFHVIYQPVPKVRPDAHTHTKAPLHCKDLSTTTTGRSQEARAKVIAIQFPGKHGKKWVGLEGLFKRIFKRLSCDA